MVSQTKKLLLCRLSVGINEKRVASKKREGEQKESKILFCGQKFLFLRRDLFSVLLNVLTHKNTHEKKKVPKWELNE